MSGAGALEFAWSLDRKAGNLSRQLADSIRRAIIEGQLTTGDRLPSTRLIASELSLARGTVTNAVELLIAEGLLEARAGAGTFVACDALALKPAAAQQKHRAYTFRCAPDHPDIDEPAIAKLDLRPCRPSLEAFPLNIWRRCLSDAASALPSSDYGDPQGAPALRRAIVDYLRRARGLVTAEPNVIITNGAIHAMHLLARLLLDGNTSAVAENPGYPLARQVLGSTGAELHYCSIDHAGMVLDELPGKRSKPALAYVTPSHQFPIGSRLSLTRRHHLIEWAQHTGALIIEDDYDGEFRYDVPPLAPLANLSSEQVIYCGTFSKTMFPGLRIGFAIAPQPIAAAMAQLRAISEYAPSDLVQRALTTFIESGEYERHILRMRRIYAAKRKALAKGLAGAGEITGIESGLHALVDLAPDHKAEEISARLRAQDALLPALSRYNFVADEARNALVFGYAAPSIKQIEQGARMIADELTR
ncbi:MAG: PLP-dependent aminotransferase family protein [Pseudomonadota bacterium]